MQGRKAPGIDGLTVEFYKAFWNVIWEDLLSVLSLAVGVLPFACRRVVIIVAKEQKPTRHYDLVPCDPPVY